MKLISSYPRSGSARLKFILCYLNYPLFSGSFSEMSKLIPSIDNPQTRADALGTQYFCTHSNIDSDIYLYRHVGDCLISEYYFKQKFFPTDMTLIEYIESTNYGEEWRKSIERGMDAPIKISFDDLSDISIIQNVFNCSFQEAKRAVTESSFIKMSQKENEYGFYYLPEGNKDIKYMRNGTSGQWKDLEIANVICRENDNQLKLLGLSKYDSEKGIYVDIQ